MTGMTQQSTINNHRTRPIGTSDTRLCHHSGDPQQLFESFMVGTDTTIPQRDSIREEYDDAGKEAGV
jgi:hypothetical protein